MKTARMWLEEFILSKRSKILSNASMSDLPELIPLFIEIQNDAISEPEKPKGDAATANMRQRVWLAAYAAHISAGVLSTESAGYCADKAVKLFDEKFPR